MLIIDKKKDIRCLIAIGASISTIKKIFFKEGILICYLGSIAGLIIGTFICFLQLKFNLLKLENSAIEYWPVIIKLKDIIMLLIIFIISGFFSAYFPGKLLVNKLINS